MDIGARENETIVEYKGGIITAFKLVHIKACGAIRKSFISYLKHPCYHGGNSRELRFETCLDGGILSGVNQAINEAKKFVDYKLKN